MSEPKRFDPLSDGMWENSAGDYVLYADYARLKAEVERLRKAGDAMAADLLCSDFPLDVCKELRKAWNAAKEGKPNA